MTAADARTRRLRVDHDKLRALAARSGGALTVDRMVGDPPAQYQITLRCLGITGLGPDGEPVVADRHVLEIRIPAAYPIQPPAVRLRTPAFHPHVFENGQVCLGARWLVGEGLDRLAIRLAAILRGDPEAFDFESVAHPAAGAWARANLHRFPLQADPFGEPEAAMTGRPRRIVWEEQG